MWFRVRHETAYGYDALVSLGPQLLRLTPRGDGLRLRSHRIEVEPEPVAVAAEPDAHGNTVTRVSFAGATRRLRVVSAFEADTLVPAALREEPAPLPWRVGAEGVAAGRGAGFGPGVAASANLSSPELRRTGGPAAHPEAALEPSVVAFAEALAAEAGWGVVAFLDRLCAVIRARTDLHIRPSGAAWPAQETLARREGACRDVTVLFIEACRCLGLAARVVSGYQAKADTADGRRHLHGWAEVFLPGAGWRGWDCTHGLRVTDGHVALCAAPTQAETLPLEGGFSFEGAGPVASTLDYAVTIEAG